MAIARCPASCGELLQGWIGDSEKLISCPIDWFSTVEVIDGHAKGNERPYMRQALQLLLQEAGLPASRALDLQIRYESSIPVGKGMASSTADIAATLYAAARHLDIACTDTDIARWCAHIEPTDSTLLPGLTLFDHNRGIVQTRLDWIPPLNLLVLEPEQQLMTADFHRQDQFAGLKAGSAMLEQAWQELQQACATHDIRLFGQATTRSAIARQALLPKPGFSRMLDWLTQFDLPGLTVAHSGTVVGFFYDPTTNDISALEQAIRNSEWHTVYPHLHHTRLIAGGIRA